MNDAIRGPGVFRLALAGAVRLARRNLLPIITIVRTWDDADEPTMLAGFTRDLLMCSNSRLVTDRGVWVCPLLVEQPDAQLGTTLDEAGRSYELRHQACVTCWRYGTICGNVSARIEGPDIMPAPEAR